MTQHDEPIVPIPADQQVNREIEFHVEMRTRELIARGIDPVVARERAVAAFGDMSRVSSELNRIGRATEFAKRRTRFGAELLQDARFAVRMLARRRMFALITIGVLALGIGAASAIFSIVDGVLLRPLPFADPDRIAAVWITQPGLANDPVISWLAEGTPIGNDDYQALRASASTLREIALWGYGAATLATDDGIEQVAKMVITSSLLPMLRVQPILGRAIAPGEDALNGANVAMVSYEAWRGRFNGDSTLIGRSVVLDRVPYTVIGVMPPGFRVERTVDPPTFWVPALRDSSDLPERHNRSYRALARLTPGASFDDASKQAGRVLRETSKDTTLSARVQMWQDDQGRSAKGPLTILFAAVALLLVIACVNVAVLQLGEVGSRRREIAARIALGAGTGRLIRQLLVESVVLSLAASILGALFAWGMLRGLLAIAPERLPGMDTVHIDGRVLAFSLACALATGVLFGIVPALAAGRGATGGLARSGIGQGTRGTRALQRTLIATQLSLSMILLVVGALFARSLRNITQIDPGFDGSSMHAVYVSLPYTYDEDRIRAIMPDIARRLAAVPGVRQVTYSSAAPFTGGTSSSPVVLDPAVFGERLGKHTSQVYAAPGFFEAMGIRMLEGRAFQETDNHGSELVAIVNTAEVARDFGGRSPLGQRIKHQGKWRTVIGVSSNAKYQALAGDDGAGLYVPYDQHPNSGVYFMVRAPQAAISRPAIRSMLRDVDARAVLQRFVWMPTQIEKSYGAERYRTILVTMFGALATLLAAVGLYGVSARAAARRMREVGIRMALGSTSRGVAGLLVGDAMSGVLIGIAVGAPAAVVVGMALKKYLYGVTPGDPVAILLVVALLAGTTLAASLIPARRAGRSSPAVVLRSD